MARIQGEMFMLAAGYNLTPTFSRWTYYFFRRPENMWKLADMFEITSAGSNIKWGGASLFILTSGSAYSADKYGVFQWKGERWIPRYQTAKSTQGVFGTADDNLFVTGERGMLVRWNGADWYEYTHLAQSDAIYAGGWADEQQVFVLGWVDGWETVVLHGRNIPILTWKVQ